MCCQVTIREGSSQAKSQAMSLDLRECQIQVQISNQVMSLYVRMASQVTSQNGFSQEIIIVPSLGQRQELMVLGSFIGNVTMFANFSW